ATCSPRSGTGSPAASATATWPHHPPASTQSPATTPPWCRACPCRPATAPAAPTLKRSSPAPWPPGKRWHRQAAEQARRSGRGCAHDREAGAGLRARPDSEGGQAGREPDGDGDGAVILSAIAELSAVVLAPGQHLSGRGQGQAVLAAGADRG